MTNGGQTFSTGGQTFTTDGQHLTTDGQNLTTGCQMLTIGGQRLTTAGQSLTTTGQTLPAGGQMVTTDGQMLTTGDRTHIADGRCLTAGGQMAMCGPTLTTHSWSKSDRRWVRPNTDDPSSTIGRPTWTVGIRRLALHMQRSDRMCDCTVSLRLAIIEGGGGACTPSTRDPRPAGLTRRHR